MTMRIGIDFRFLSAGRSAINRGFGRYSQTQLREVLRLDTVNRYVLVCRPDADRAALDPSIACARNAEFQNVPDTLCRQDGPPNSPSRLQRAAEFQEWLSTLDLDLYHLTVPFLRLQPSGTGHDTCPLVATQYDLIPLVYRDHYLAGPDRGDVRSHFVDSLRLLKHADGLLAISQYVRNEACTYLGISQERAGVAYPATSPVFRPIPLAEARLELATLSTRIGTPIPQEFLLAVSHLHHSKNLRTLLCAVSLLPRSWRLAHPLVLACDVTDAERRSLEGWAREFEVEESFVATGFVTDSELVALYSTARLFVHPSRQEGFGLPVLEALQCGAPVIASRAGALPEVVGQAGVLVDPEDPQAFATAMLTLGDDQARCHALREIGQEQAAHFRPEALGEATLAFYERFLQPGSGRSGGFRRPRLAIWTPLPPHASGVADYSAELLEHLREWADIELFVDGDFAPDAAILDRFGVFHYSAFERRNRLYPFDLVVYQLGVSTFHAFMADALTRWPGLVVLHDLTWSHVLYYLAGSGNIPLDFKASLARLEGAGAVDELTQIELHAHDARYGDLLSAFLSDHLMLGDVMSASRGVIVHYPEAKRELERRYPAARVFAIPMGVTDPFVGAPRDKGTLRSRHGLDPEGLVIGVIGIADPVKRIEVTLEALARLRTLLAAELDGSHRSAVQLIVVGAFSSSAYEGKVRRRVIELGLESQVRILGRVSQADWYELVLVCDVVVNLRYPSRKQMSATVMRAIAAGKPIAVTKLAEWGFLPEDFCAFVPVGPEEVGTLAAFLHLLVVRPDRRDQMSRAAREYYLEHATVAGMSENYKAIIGELLGERSGEVAAMTPAARTARPPRQNRVFNVDDLRDPVLAGLIREIFPTDAASGGADFPASGGDRRHWATAMAVRTLADAGLLRRDASALGIGAGTDRITFYLTEKMGRVVAADRYFDAGRAPRDEQALMLLDPGRCSGYPCDRSRLSVQHVDPRVLTFADETFEAAYCHGVLEHLPDWASVGAAAYEAGRVLKPGGVLSVVTTWLVAGPAGGSDGDPTRVFDDAALSRYVVAASGLELVDAADFEVSEATLAAARDLSAYVEPRAPGRDGCVQPLCTGSGTVVGLVHLALRKGAAYPAQDNRWAAPSPELRAEMDRRIAHLANRLNGRFPYRDPEAPAVAELARAEVELEAARFTARLLSRQLAAAVSAQQQDLANRVQELTSYIEAVRTSRPWRMINFFRRLVGRSW